jgi:hypothetical protein
MAAAIIGFSSTAARWQRSRSHGRHTWDTLVFGVDDITRLPMDELRGSPVPISHVTKNDRPCVKQKKRQRSCPATARARPSGGLPSASPGAACALRLSRAGWAFLYFRSRVRRYLSGGGRPSTIDSVCDLRSLRDRRVPPIDVRFSTSILPSEACRCAEAS